MQDLRKMINNIGVLLMILLVGCNDYSLNDSDYRVVFDANKSRQIDSRIYLLVGSDTIFNTMSYNYIFMIENSFLHSNTSIDWSCILLREYPTLTIELPNKILEAEERILRKICNLQNYRKGNEYEIGMICKELFFSSLSSSLESDWKSCERSYRDVIIRIKNDVQTNFEQLAFTRNFDSCQISNVLATGYYVKRSLERNSSEIYFSESGCNYMNVKSSDNDLIIHSKPYYRLYFTYDGNSLIPHLRCENPLSLLKVFH